MHWVRWLFFLLISQVSNAAIFVLSNQTNQVGKNYYAFSEPGETLAEAGLRHGIGHVAMQKANPNLPPNQVLSTSTRLLIPGQFTLPKAPRKGIVVNLAEHRLYYFPSDENLVITFPVGIGRKGWETPLGITKVVAKERNPVWHPSQKLRAEAESNGFSLPEYFPASPYNPLGKYALRLGWSGYLIHGTNNTRGIGEQVSAGCIRMQEEDIEYLYSRVKTGTEVRVLEPGNRQTLLAEKQ